MDDVTGPLFQKTSHTRPHTMPTVATFSSDLAIVVATVVVPWFCSLHLEGSLNSAVFLLPAFALCITWMALLLVTGTYEPDNFTGRSLPFKQITLATILSFGIFAIADVVFFDSLPHSLFFVSLPLGLTLLITSRLVLQRMLPEMTASRQRTRNAVALIGGTGVDSSISPIQQSQQLGLKLTSCIDVQDALRAPSLEDLVLEELRRNHADTLIISTFAGLNTQQTHSLKWALDDANIRLIFMLPIDGVSVGRMSVRSGMEPALLEIKNSHYTGLYFQVKRLLDIVLSAFGLLFLLPVFAIIALVVKLYDDGPIFYSQVRVGHNRQTFRMIKFRTMKINADAEIPNILDTNKEAPAAGNEVLFKLKHDPRITAPGRFLRQYSLDELPQLINVLIGDMTLIGPRPPLPREVEQFEPHVLRKFLVKPGMTGMWQTMGRSNLSWEESVKLDLYYVENCSPWLDLTIMAKTFKAVISKDGAF